MALASATFRHFARALSSAYNHVIILLATGNPAQAITFLPYSQTRDSLTVNVLKLISYRFDLTANKRIYLRNSEKVLANFDTISKPFDTEIYILYATTLNLNLNFDTIYSCRHTKAIVLLFVWRPMKDLTDSCFTMIQEFL